MWTIWRRTGRNTLAEAMDQALDWVAAALRRASSDELIDFLGIFSPALAAVEEYLECADERERLIATLSYAAAKVQNDPHIERLCVSSIEEYRHNSTSRKDDILRGWTKYLSRGIRRATDLACFEMYRRHFGA